MVITQETELVIPFGRLLRLGSHGQDVRGVQRGLGRWDGVNDPSTVTIFGPGSVLRLRRFQAANGLVVDGVYGPKSHALLSPFFDSYAFLLYTGKQPHPQPVNILLPRVFKPTHQTAGLPGYPAIDVFGQPGASVGGPCDGLIRRLSGHDPKEGGVKGGAYGWSIYLATADADYFLTHFATRAVVLGQTVKQGDKLGTICDAKVAGMLSSASHIHEGKHVGPVSGEV